MMENMFSGLMEKLLDPKKIAESILPLEMNVKIKVYQAKDKSFIIQFLPIEEAKKE